MLQLAGRFESIVAGAHWIDGLLEEKKERERELLVIVVSVPGKTSMSPIGGNGNDENIYSERDKSKKKHSRLFEIVDGDMHREGAKEKKIMNISSHTSLKKKKTSSDRSRERKCVCVCVWMLCQRQNIGRETNNKFRMFTLFSRRSFDILCSKHSIRWLTKPYSLTLGWWRGDWIIRFALDDRI